MRGKFTGIFAAVASEARRIFVDRGSYDIHVRIVSHAVVGAAIRDIAWWYAAVSLPSSPAVERRGSSTAPNAEKRLKNTIFRVVDVNRLIIDRYLCDASILHSAKVPRLLAILQPSERCVNEATVSYQINDDEQPALLIFGAAVKF